MGIIAQKQRYMPHEISTRVNAVKAYRETGDIRYVCRKYHVSKASLMRWNKRYDGERESLPNRSHRPHSPHPNAHTAEELKWIADLHGINIAVYVSMFHPAGSMSRQPLLTGSSPQKRN